MQINKDRTIEISLSPESNEGNTEDTSWRSNLSRILNRNTGRRNIKANATSTDISNVTRKNLFNLVDTNVNNNIDLLMTSPPLGINSDNSYSQPIKNAVESLTGSGTGSIVSNIATTAINAISAYNDVWNEDSNYGSRTAQVFQPWTKNIKAWTGTKSSGVTFDYEFTFALGQYGLWNAEEEVVKPIINLIAPTLPQYINSWGMAGPFPSTAELLLRMVKNHFKEDKSFKDEKGDFKASLVVSGVLNKAKGYFSDVDNISDGILSGLDLISDILQDLVESSYKNLTYTIKFGKIIQFDKIMITDASTTFSNEVDENGFPVSGTAKLTFIGMVPLALINDTGYGETQMFYSASTRYGG